MKNNMYKHFLRYFWTQTFKKNIKGTIFDTAWHILYIMTIYCRIIHLNSLSASLSKT